MSNFSYEESINNQLAEIIELLVSINQTLRREHVEPVKVVGRLARDYDKIKCSECGAFTGHTEICSRREQ